MGLAALTLLSRVGLAALTLLSRVADDQPLLCVIDDLVITG